jgi:hypothetical protein
MLFFLIVVFLEDNETKQIINKNNIINKIQDPKIQGSSNNGYVGVFIAVDESSKDLQKIFRLKIDAKDNDPFKTPADGTCFLRVLYQLNQRHNKTDITDELNPSPEYFKFIDNILEDSLITSKIKEVISKVKNFYQNKIKNTKSKKIFPKDQWQEISFHKQFKNIPITIFEKHYEDNIEFNYLTKI